MRQRLDDRPGPQRHAHSRPPAWRERNLARLKRSLLKLRGERGVDRSNRIRACVRYDAQWNKGY
jgi:3-deoxy-D-manno-octulosonic acid kinase